MQKLMTKSIHQVQQRIKYLKEEIHDTLQLISLNNQSVICLTAINKDSNNKQKDSITQSNKKSPYQQCGKNQQQSKKQSRQQQQCERQQQSQKSLSKQQTTKNIIFNRHCAFQQQISTINTLLQSRTQHHLNYLIVRQIQGEQESVRRDRLNQYEDKIYDQRRIICDKQVFLQNLYRPKKQRPETMTSEQFLQLRAKQRVEEERVKHVALEEQIKKLAVYQQMLSEVKIKSLASNNNNNNSQQQQQSIDNNQQQQQHSEKMVRMKEQDLQKTKAHSLETVNLSAFNNLHGEKQDGIIEETELNTIMVNHHANNNNHQLQQQHHIHQQQHQNWSKDTPNNAIAVHSNLPIKANKSINRLQLIEDNDKRHFSMSQNGKQHNINGCYSIQISKLINGCEKELKTQEGKVRIGKIKQLLKRIQKKKEENSVKMKQLKEMENQNVHMHAHVKKVKASYIAQLNQLKNLNIQNNQLWTKEK